MYWNWKYFCILVICLGFLGFFVMNQDYIDDYIADMFMGEKTILEGEFMIINKNDYRSFWVNEKSFTLESDTKERYVVNVSDTVYQSYLVNDKIKATFETYSECDACRNFKVEGIVANENE
ncbi:MAG: hypothetical protein K2N51_08785 [Lachnospiraceae bacterium]|nr:hypothetical protein [Lachnospiraceae bacterium]